MEIIFKQRIVGSIVIIAILSMVLPFIVISKDEVFNKKLISNIPSKPVYKISLPNSNDDPSGNANEMVAQGAVEDRTQKSNFEQATLDGAAKNALQPPNINNTLGDDSATSRSAASKNEIQNIDKKQIALIIPLADQTLKTDHATKSEIKTTSEIKGNENSSATNVGIDSTKPSSKLVASAPKGELALPDLASISKVLKDFVRQDSSSEALANDASDTKNNKNLKTSLVSPEQSTSASSATEPAAPNINSRSQADKGLAHLPLQSSVTLSRNSPPVVNRGWVVQVGSFLKKSNATKLQHKLSKRGHNSYVELAKSKHGIIYRVRVGPQKNQTRAKLVQSKILKQEKLESIVLRYPR